jgi:hypothetical protein
VIFHGPVCLIVTLPTWPFWRLDWTVRLAKTRSLIWYIRGSGQLALMYSRCIARCSCISIQKISRDRDSMLSCISEYF